MEIDIPEGHPVFPWRVPHDAQAIERASALALCEKFVGWEEDEQTWRKFRAEVLRLEQRVGAEALRSLIYNEGEQPVLGIFIRTDHIPAEGMQALFK